MSFRKTSARTTRTIDLPSYPALAEKTVVLVAGNVARDEASEALARESSKVQPSAASTPSPTTGTARETAAAGDRDEGAEFARVRAVVGYQASLARTRRWVIGGTYLALGVGAATAAEVANATSSSSRRYDWLAGTGAGYAFLGGLTLAGVFSSSESFERWLDREVAPGTSIEAVLDEWHRRADKARTFRYGLGGVVMAAAVTSLAWGGYDLVSDGAAAHRDTDQFLIAAGAGALLTGFALLMWESPIESSYETFVRASPKPKPIVSAGPLNGGGMVSVGATF